MRCARSRRRLLRATPRPAVPSRRRAEPRELSPYRPVDAVHYAARTRPGVTSSSWAGSSGQGRRLRRRHERLAAPARVPPAPAGVWDRAPRARRRGAASGRTPRRSASSSASASRSASTVSRCSPCEPKLRRSREPLASDDIVEMRAEAGRPALEIAVETRLERGRRGRLALVRRCGAPRQSELPCAVGEPRRERGEHLDARLDELARRAPRPAPSRARSHRARRSPRATRRRAAFRCAIGGRVLGRQRRRAPAARRAERAVEVGAPRRRAALHDREPVRREDERRDLRAQLLRRPASAAPFSVARLPALDAQRDRQA